MKSQRVYISGEVKYGDEWYRVASEGTLIEKGKKESLVNIDEIDGDFHACVYVSNSMISNI